MMLINRGVSEIALLLILAGCTKAGPPSSLGREELVRRIVNKDGPALELTNFKKTDGVLRDQAGQKLYVMQFTAGATFRTDAMYSLGDPLTSSGQSITTTTMRENQGAIEGFMTASEGFRPAQKGDELQITGEIEFERRESGWVPVNTILHAELKSASMQKNDNTIAAVSSNTDRRTAIQDMIETLRNLQSQQEVYFSIPANSYRYSSDVSQLPDFKPSPGVRVKIASSNQAGWSATAEFDGLPEDKCAIFIGRASPLDPATEPGVVNCRGPISAQFEKWRKGAEADSQAARNARATPAEKLEDVLNALSSAQMEYYVAHGERYADQLADLPKFVAPSGSEIRLLSGGLYHWAAVAKTPRNPKVFCGIFIGSDSILPEIAELLRSHPKDPNSGFSWEGMPMCK